MFNSHRLLLMVKVGYMSISRCDRCGGKAIIHGYDGSWRCVVCTPKDFKWNKKTMSYE